MKPGAGLEPVVAKVWRYARTQNWTARELKTVEYLVRLVFSSWAVRFDPVKSLAKLSKKFGKCQ